MIHLVKSVTAMTLLLIMLFPVAAFSEDASLEEQVRDLRGTVFSLRADLRQISREIEALEDKYIYGPPLAILFGAFCALWAQNTRRNAWLWFFMGAFFNVITVLVLLGKNSSDPPHIGGSSAARLG